MDLVAINALISLILTCLHGLIDVWKEIEGLFPKKAGETQEERLARQEARRVAFDSKSSEVLEKQLGRPPTNKELAAAREFAGVATV